MNYRSFSIVLMDMMFAGVLMIANSIAYAEGTPSRVYVLDPRTGELRPAGTNEVYYSSRAGQYLPGPRPPEQPARQQAQAPSNSTPIDYRASYYRERLTTPNMSRYSTANSCSIRCPRGSCSINCGQYSIAQCACYGINGAEPLCRCL